MIANFSRLRRDSSRRRIVIASQTGGLANVPKQLAASLFQRGNLSRTETAAMTTFSPDIALIRRQVKGAVRDHLRAHRGDGQLMIDQLFITALGCRLKSCGQMHVSAEQAPAIQSARPHLVSLARQPKSTTLAVLTSSK